VVWRAIRYGRHAAGRHRATISRPGAGSAAGVRVAGDRRQPLLRIGWPSSDRNAVSDVTPHGEGRIFARLEPCSPSCLILRDAAKTPLLRAVKNTDLILRSLRSKRLEGWTQRMDSRPSFETRPRGRSSG